MFDLNDLSKYDKEQVFLMGLLFGSTLSYKDSIIDITHLSKENIIKISREMKLDSDSMYFFLDFLYHNGSRKVLAKKYGYHIGSIYNKYKSIKNKIQKFLNKNQNLIDF